MGKIRYIQTTESNNIPGFSQRDARRLSTIPVGAPQPPIRHSLRCPHPPEPLSSTAAHSFPLPIAAPASPRAPPPPSYEQGPSVSTD